MDEVIFLFLYHETGPATLRHFTALQRFHPNDQIIPVGYQMKCPTVLPGTVDVANSDDFGWPITDTWREIDKIFLRWYLTPDRPRARRYVFFEYDVQVNTTAQTFYGNAWDADAAGVSIKTPLTTPEWPWWSQAPQLGDAFRFRCGLSPMAATLWSDEALNHISQARRFQNCHCELRMGTLAAMHGFRLADIPKAAWTVSWQAKDIRITDEANWFHPVKT